LAKPLAEVDCQDFSTGGLYTLPSDRAARKKILASGSHSHAGRSRDLGAVRDATNPALSLIANRKWWARQGSNL
jgi:hypothetical protein